MAFQLAGAGWAQEATRDRPAMEEAVPEPEAVTTPAPRYTIPIGAGGINISVGVAGRYVDNVFLTHDDTKDDFVLVPELNFASLFPIGLSNALVLDVGLAYYQYFKNTELNTGTPLVNPNSDLALNLQVGKFTLRASEAFSYQEDPVYDYGGTFYNIYNTGRFARYDNLVGANGTWDLHPLVVTAGYHHENLWANGSEFDYVNHASELFNADALVDVGSGVRVGAEGAGSINRFDLQQQRNSWRARGGPALRWDVSRFIRVRVGGGYERIDYDSSQASSLGIGPQNTYYAYGGVDHDINRFLSHSFEVVHDNQLGYNAGNLAGTRLNYYLSWRPNRKLTISPLVSLNFFEESYGSAFVFEKFTYVAGGLAVLYQFTDHWRAGLDYEYRLHDSETPGVGYTQNRVGVELLYAF